jgi:HEAT repeat protein
MIKHRGIVYHFYCAVGDQGRVIALATSRDLSQQGIALKSHYEQMLFEQREYDRLHNAATVAGLLSRMTGEMKSEPIERILPFLAHGEWQIRGCAARAIIGNKGALREDVREALAKAAAADKNIYSLPDILQAIGYTKAKQATPVLSEIMVHNENSHIRYAAVEALYWVRDAKAVPSLLEAMRDADPKVALRSIYVLARINDARALPQIREVALHGKGDMQVQAVQSLGIMRDTASCQSLLPLLETKDERLLEYVVWSLGRMSCEKAVRALISLTAHDNNKIRKTSYQALLDIANLEVLTYFIDRYGSKPGDRPAVDAISVVYHKRENAFVNQRDKLTSKDLSTLASYLSDALPPEHKKIFTRVIKAADIKSVRIIKDAYFVLAVFEHSHSHLEFLVLRNDNGDFVHAKIIGSGME